MMYHIIHCNTISILCYDNQTMHYIVTYNREVLQVRQIIRFRVTEQITVTQEIIPILRLKVTVESKIQTYHDPPAPPPAPSPR